MIEHFFKNFQFHYSQSDKDVFVTIVVTTISFIVFWFLTQSIKLRNKLWKKDSYDNESFKHFFFSKISGFIFLGCIPCLIMLIYFNDWGLSQFGLYYNNDTIALSLEWILILVIIVIPIVYSSAKKPKNLINYPQIRAKLWDTRIFYFNLLGWFLYLFGYELLFRGILLFPLVKTIGIWPAIAVNISLYSATHIPKGLDETIGALFIGFVLCILTIVTDTIWIAFFVHVAMAWTNSLTALKFHPEIHYSKWKKK